MITLNEKDVLSAINESLLNDRSDYNNDNESVYTCCNLFEESYTDEDCFY